MLAKEEQKTKKGRRTQCKALQIYINSVKDTAAEADADADASAGTGAETESKLRRM